MYAVISFLLTTTVSLVAAIFTSGVRVVASSFTLFAVLALRCCRFTLNGC